VRKVGGEAISDFRFNISEFGLKERKSQPRGGGLRNKAAREEKQPRHSSCPDAQARSDGAKYD